MIINFSAINNDCLSRYLLIVMFSPLLLKSELIFGVFSGSVYFFVMGKKKYTYSRRTSDPDRKTLKEQNKLTALIFKFSLLPALPEWDPLFFFCVEAFSLFRLVLKHIIFTKLMLKLPNPKAHINLGSKRGNNSNLSVNLREWAAMPSPRERKLVSIMYIDVPRETARCSLD